MLELPSASASASAPNPAAGAAVRHVGGQDLGFQGRLREVLGNQDAQQQDGRNQTEARRARLPETAKSVEEGPPRLTDPAVDGHNAAEKPPSEFTAGDDPSNSPAHTMDAAAGSITPPPEPQDSVPAKSEAVANASILGTQAYPPMPNAVTSQMGGGGGVSAPPAGQAASLQAAMAQQGDPNVATPEQEAVMTALAAGEAAATQPGKPAQTALKAGLPTPAEATESAKAAMTSALLAQNLGAEEATEEAKSGLPSALLAQSLGAGEATEEANPILLGEAAEAGLGSVELGGAKNVIAKHVVENESHIIPGQGFGLAIQDGTFPRADAPMQSAAAREMPAPPPPVRQLAPVLVSLALGGGNEALTITLDPGELGRVEVSIGQGKDAGQVRIIAERPETLALLQRDQRELDRALNQAGLGDMARSLSFSLASDQGRQQQRHAAQDEANRFAALTSGQEAEHPLMPPMPAPSRASTSLIDLAV